MMKAVWLSAALFIGWSSSAHAYDDKVCYPSNGVPTTQTFAVTKSIDKTSNKANSTIIPRTSTTSSGQTVFTCTCSSPNTKMAHWWSSKEMFPYTTDSKGHWQQITPNMAANVEIYVYNSTGGETKGNYHSIPFTGITNRTNEICGLKNHTADTGKSGTVTLKITKAAIGSISFKGLVGKMFHYRKANYINTADPVEVAVYLDLNLTIQGGCTLLPGSVLNVDLGDRVKQSDFNGQAYPSPPKSYTPVQFDLKFDCDFSDSEMNIVLTGSTDAQGQGFATDKKDVSVIVTDKNGTVLPPNTLAGSVDVNSDSTTSTLSLKAYPANSGSNPAPGVGAYESTATILLSYK